MKRNIIAALLVFTFVCVAAAQSKQKVTNVRVDLQGIYGPLFITSGGKEKKVADEAQQAWIINGGWQVVYSASDGAGGFENEGQSLYLYDVRTGTRKRILSEYVAVDQIEEVTTSTKKRVLLVDMVDGGLGASYVAVVDPRRGEVFFRRHARILSRKGDVINIGFYKEDDWEKLDSPQNAKVRPYKTERHNLNSLLQRRVIVNKRSM
ncbi:MAG TPA: hypothetical protein VJS17_01895 [Pyrinomonadaceae bacterium]|nr:hypothetical protein [Pyrinomonadaceae bacterium]